MSRHKMIRWFSAQIHKDYKYDTDFQDTFHAFDVFK